MKIISKFSDFYDIGLAYGIDEKLRFNRSTKEINLDTELKLYINEYEYIKDLISYKLILYFNYLGFCKKIYPFIKIEIYEVGKKNKEYFNLLKYEDYCYSQDSLIESILSQVSKTQIQKITKRRWGKSNYIYRIFDDFKNTNLKELYEVFETYKTPYFVFEQSYKKTINKRTNEFEFNLRCKIIPKLKNYKFVKIKNPMQTFQEISMYLGELNHKEDNIIKIEDKYLQKAKGFNEFSFKKISKK